MEQIIRITDFIFKSFLHIWPYLLVTIPLAVIINLSGASKYISRAFGNNPLISVFLATIVGAFSPFCSCGVIPVISSLLIGGVPLAPVMSFWIASPSMDPEIFFLSSSLIGWELAIWRLASTFTISLLAGYITYILTVKGFIGIDILNIRNQQKKRFTVRSAINSTLFFLKRKHTLIQLSPIDNSPAKNACCNVPVIYKEKESDGTGRTTAGSCGCKDSYDKKAYPGMNKILQEILKATFMVAKFMGVAFLITAIINFYVPEDLISWIIKGDSTLQVALAALIGIPMYTSNITALPMVGGLIDMGLNKGAALSFLIAGATTTIPAMVAVWGITKKRIFLLYILFALFGSLMTGLLFNLLG